MMLLVAPTLALQLGGDQFAIILDNNDDDDQSRLRKALRERVKSQVLGFGQRPSKPYLCLFFGKRYPDQTQSRFISLSSAPIDRHLLIVLHGEQHIVFAVDNDDNTDHLMHVKRTYSSIYIRFFLVRGS
jgi:GGDEF domain-containing protein